jgi:hypothetical protein
MKNIITVIALSSVLLSCSSDKIKEKINETGETTGEVIGEFSTGVSSGVEKALEVNIELSEALKTKGITFGKQTINNDVEGTDNLLIVYVIFNQYYKGDITAKAFDSKGQEMGRVKISVEGKKDEAQYLEFHFDKRTNIDSDSKITLE